MTTATVSPEPETKPRKSFRWFTLFAGNSFLVSVLLHVLFAVGATYFIVEHFQKKHVNFRATEPPGQHTEVEHKVELAKKNNVESAPQDLKRITTTDISPVSLPDVPETPKVSDPTPTLTAGEGDLGAGMGGGAGTGGDGSGYGSFGVSDGLIGTLYDLKQTPDKKPTDEAENAAELGSVNQDDPAWFTSPATRNQLQLLRDFVVDWNISLLDGYYKAPVTLSAAQLCIPPGPSEDAPKAFRVDDTVRGRRWVAIYHAKITPPENGRYRFIGFGDDFLVVHVDGQNVLDGSESVEPLSPGANVKEDVGKGVGFYATQPYSCGSWIEMEAGISADLQILIGEGPGGASGFILMIQKEGDNSAKGDYPVFQLRDAPIPDNDPLAPPSKKKMLFNISQK